MSKVISFAEEKRKIKRKAKEEIATLVWLYCPSCQTIEYSELLAPAGRFHKCGTKVLEQEVKVDITAEFTICQKNISYLENLEKKEQAKTFSQFIKKLKFIELQMIDKLKRITKQKEIFFYEWKKENQHLLPIAQINSLGLIISNFRFCPEKRFSKNKLLN